MRKALTVLVMLAVAAFASDPRLFVLGGDARLMLDDYLEMWAYPGVIGDYEFVTGESETDQNISDGWFGMTKNFGGTTFGLTINHNDYMHEFIFSPGGWGAILSIDYGKFYNEEEIYQKEAAIGLAWGTEIALFGDYTDLALGVGYDKTNIDIEDVNPYYGDLNFGASVRGHQDSFFNLFPIISVGFNQGSNGDDENDYSISNISFDLGAGHNHMIAPKTQFVAGAFVGVTSISYGGDYEDMDSQMIITVPRLSGGVEQSIGKYFILRAGATSNTQYWSWGDTNELTTGFNTNFGVGLKWDNFILDATIAEDFLHDGPYMVGGVGNGFLGQVAATYNF
ncbi:MAG: hypothetical protein R6V62_06085 [Candidatus Fermentibacteraceae bacterium]